MARELSGHLNEAVGRSLGALLLDAVLVALAAALAVISLAFSALAAYVLLVAIEDRSNAALVVCGAAGLFLMALLTLWGWNRGGLRSRRAADNSSFGAAWMEETNPRIKAKP